MFDINKFYRGLLTRTNYFDNYWESFPHGNLMRFRKETLLILKESVKRKSSNELSCILAIIYRDGADKDYTDILLSLLDEKWHTSEEDIVNVLEIIKDPRSINKLYDLAINVPNYDDMRALAKKCMWALKAINTVESFEKLKLLKKSKDPIIKENATFQLKTSEPPR